MAGNSCVKWWFKYWKVVPKIVRWRRTKRPRDASTSGAWQPLIGSDRMTKSTCSVDGCIKEHYGRGWCKYHYQKAYLAGRLEDGQRTLAKPTDSLDTRLRNIGWTVTPSGCWEWSGSLDANGYGQLAVNRGRPWGAYRIAYEAWVKVPEPNVDICHRCDNPPCINPSHLFEGSRAVNVADAVSKMRHVHGERQKHKLKDRQVTEIRARHAAGGVTQRALSVEYGVSQAQISNITTWKQRKHETHQLGA